MHLDAPGDVGLIADQVMQPRLERVGQGFREGRQQHPRLGVTARQKDCTMQRDDGLAGPCRPRASYRAALAALGEAARRRVTWDCRLLLWEGVQGCAQS